MGLMALCTVCKNPGVRKVVDGYLEEGVSGAGTSRALADLGLSVSSDVINQHKRHYAPPPERPKGTLKRDFAIYMRDRIQTAVEAIEPETDENGKTYDPVLSKHLQPAIASGLKAEAQIEKREQAVKKQTQADVLLALLASLRGEGRPMLQLEDPNVIEGTAREVV